MGKKISGVVSVINGTQIHNTEQLSNKLVGRPRVGKSVEIKENARFPGSLGARSVKRPRTGTASGVVGGGGRRVCASSVAAHATLGQDRPPASRTPAVPDERRFSSGPATGASKPGPESGVGRTGRFFCFNRLTQFGSVVLSIVWQFRGSKLV